MYLELKKAIFNWLCENKNKWQRVNECHKVFRTYIYDNEGNYLIGGSEVSEFIKDADKLIYKEK